LRPTEQHGPHLPFATDGGDQWHAGGAPPSAAGLDILVRPTQEIGKANEHVYGAGTLSLGAELLIPVWTAIGAKVAEAGIVERELRVRYQSRYRVVLT
jgi:creatinine amidohydrolase